MCLRRVECVCVRARAVSVGMCVTGSDLTTRLFVRCGVERSRARHGTARWSVVCLSDAPSCVIEAGTADADRSQATRSRPGAVC